MPVPLWEKENVETLIELWKTHSAGEIARIMEITRNEVCGKLYRLRKEGVKLEHNQPIRGGEKEKRANPKLMKKRPADERKEPERVLVPFRRERLCSLLELDKDRCHFPLRYACNADDPVYCGGECVPGKPYCPHHCRISYNSVASQLRHSRAELQRSEALLQSSTPVIFLGRRQR